MERPVLILGAGINGAAVARELALNGIGVVVVDTADLAYGATAYSSRLIHGGLRYLEHGDFSLVRESLEERRRLLWLAPQFVRPLRLFIPVNNRWGGLWNSTRRFFGLPAANAASSRGLYLVRMGLWLYDTYARDRTLPRRSVHRIGDPNVPQINPHAARWLCAYSDAQIAFPERFVVALLKEAQHLAQRKGTRFEVLTYHQARMNGTTAEITPVRPAFHSPPKTVDPCAIVNATGAWVDHSLAKLQFRSKRLMGGTKGTHFFTFRRRLRKLLGDQGVYAEAKDGRPVFVLPLGAGTLVGTTDVPFKGDPADAVATEEELQYLLDLTTQLFPDADLMREDIAWHYAGVRPLPFSDASTPAAITRRHHLVWNEESPAPLLSLVGGKLTTCRSLAEEAARAIFRRLELPGVFRDSRDQRIDGEALPQNDHNELIRGGATVHGGAYLVETVRRVIRDEWVSDLTDLVERRLMLLYTHDLTRKTVEDLADLLVGHGQFPVSGTAVDDCCQRLRAHFGHELKRFDPNSGRFWSEFQP